MSRASDAFITVQNAYDNGWQAAREMENVAHKFECEADQAHEELAAEKGVVSGLQAEVAAWQKWASSSRCIYCDAEFIHDPINQDAADELKKAHILVCPKHPCGQVVALLREFYDKTYRDHYAEWGDLTDRIRAVLQPNPLAGRNAGTAPPPAAVTPPAPRPARLMEACPELDDDCGGCPHGERHNKDCWCEDATAPCPACIPVTDHA